MSYTPSDIYKYVKENDYESDFMVALSLNKNNFSIGEITDARYKKKEKGWYLHSDSYHLNILMEDDDVITALTNELYVSTFISRYQDSYNVHFLVHQYPQSMKSQFDDQILNEVVRYMVMMTIIRLRLDTPKKVDEYLGK